MAAACCSMCYNKQTWYFFSPAVGAVFLEADFLEPFDVDGLLVSVSLLKFFNIDGTEIDQ